MKNYLILSSFFSAFFLTACGGGDGDSETTTPKPVEYVPSQYKTLNDDFKYVKEPMSEIQHNYLYNISYWVDENPLIISSYSYLYPENNSRFKQKNYSTSGAYSNTWQQDSSPTLVFNIAKNKWVESDNTLNMSQGPVGTEGIQSIYVESDTGIKYFTLTAKDLSGMSLDKGINQGFGNGILLPEQIKNQYFSAGATAYAWVQDITQPVYSIGRTHIVFTSTNKVRPIYSCNTITSYCGSTPYSLEHAIQNNAWYVNTGNNGSIRLNQNNTADVSVYDKELKKNLDYKVKYEVIAAKQGIPKHILFSAPDTTTNMVLQEYFSAGDDQLAWYEYRNQVVQGSYSLPVNGLQSTQYSYNKIAINDLLTKWYPKKNPVLE